MEENLLSGTKEKTKRNETNPTTPQPQKPLLSFFPVPAHQQAIDKPTNTLKEVVGCLLLHFVGWLVRSRSCSRVCACVCVRLSRRHFSGVKTIAAFFYLGWDLWPSRSKPRRYTRQKKEGNKKQTKKKKTEDNAGTCWWKRTDRSFFSTSSTTTIIVTIAVAIAIAVIQAMAEAENKGRQGIQWRRMRCHHCPCPCPCQWCKIVDEVTVNTSIASFVASAGDATVRKRQHCFVIQGTDRRGMERIS